MTEHVSSHTSVLRFQTSSSPSLTMSDIPGLLSLYNLLARASHVSCSKGANDFLSLPVTEDDRLSLAIDGFLPSLQNPSLQVSVIGFRSCN